jgi:hypothetical protein
MGKRKCCPRQIIKNNYYLTRERANTIMAVDTMLSILLGTIVATVKTVNTLETSVSPIDFSKAIVDYGVTIVLAGMFLYLIFRIINMGLKHIDSRWGNKQHDKLLDMRSEIGEEVQQLLEQFVTEHKGERAQVIEFSNTVMSVAYLPFKYMTCTYEVCSFGVVSQGHRIDHMSTSLFTHFFKNLRENDYCIFDIENHDLLVGGAMYDLMNSMEQKKLLCCMLTTHSGKAIGYISFQKDSGYDISDIQDIQRLSKEITALLGVMDK